MFRYICIYISPVAYSRFNENPTQPIIFMIVTIIVSAMITVLTITITMLTSLIIPVTFARGITIVIIAIFKTRLSSGTSRLSP